MNNLNRPPTSAINKKPCPVNDSEIDVIPEYYHYSNRCLCFMCTCGEHQCPSQKKSIYKKGTFQTNYQRTYSKPLIPLPPQRVQSLYHPNRQKMDMETEYMKNYPGFKVECSPVPHAISPQPRYKFKGHSQYNRDFPDWGPVDYLNVKRPVQPIHETKLKFEAVSIYESAFQSIKSKSTTKLNKPTVVKESGFKFPLQSSSHRDYQKISIQHFPAHEHRKIEEFIPLSCSPNQYKTTAHSSFITIPKYIKDPVQIRKQASKIN